MPFTIAELPAPAPPSTINKSPSRTWYCRISSGAYHISFKSDKSTPSKCTSLAQMYFSLTSLVVDASGESIFPKVTLNFLRNCTIFHPVGRAAVHSRRHSCGVSAREDTRPPVSRIPLVTARWTIAFLSSSNSSICFCLTDTTLSISADLSARKFTILSCSSRFGSGKRMVRNSSG